MGRTIKKQFWLNREEAEALKRNAQKTCLSETALVRLLISGFEPREKPDEEFYHAMREIAAIGNNMNQIAAKLNSRGEIDVDVLNNEIGELKAFRIAIMKKYLEAEKASWL